LIRCSSVKTEQYFDLTNFSVEYRHSRIRCTENGDKSLEHMNKTWLLPIVASYSAAPEAGLLGDPWNIA
jgi:hypothetical protein